VVCVGIALSVVAGGSHPQKSGLPHAGGVRLRRFLKIRCQLDIVT